MKLTPEQRDDVADDAATRCRAGESWAEIAARNCLTPQYVYRLTVARHNIDYRKWGQRPVANVIEVLKRKDNGQTLDQIAEIHGAIRAALTRRFGAHGDTVPILYGGSVKAANAREILALPNVDGALVGGASLRATDFLPIVEAGWA